MKREQIEAVLQSYREAIKELQLTRSSTGVDTAIEKLENKGLDCGMCKVVGRLFGSEARKEFSLSIEGGYNGGFMFNPPFNCNTMPEILAALRFRVDFLKRYLEKNFEPAKTGGHESDRL